MPKTYEPIATQTVSGTPTTVTFSSIPQTYTDIHYVIYTPTIAGVNTNANFNGDTGTNYSWMQLYGDGSAAGSFRGNNQAYMLAGVSDGISAIQGDIMNYTNTTTYKTLLTRGGGGRRYVESDINLWRSTAAITSINFVAANWSDGSVITIYGIKAA
jgi:hypothetical protein